MSMTGTEAARQAVDGAPGMVGAMLGRLADRLGGKASVTAAFGQPVVADGVTVIPVARVGFGFGGGAGRNTGRERASGDGEAGRRTPPGSGEGGGGGGGAEARPLGFIEITDGTARYRPIRDPWGDVALPLAALAAGLVAPKVARLIARRSLH